MRRTLALAVALLALLPAGAEAQSRLIETQARQWSQRTELGGPRLAGDDVLFMERRSSRAADDLATVAEGPAGRRDLDVTPARGAERFAFDAADGRFAFASFHFSCEGDEACDRYNGAYPVDWRLRTGSLDGPARDVPPLRCSHPQVAEDVVGFDCSSGYIREADGSTRKVDGFRMQLEGPFLAFAVPFSGAIAVQRRATGEEVLRLDVEHAAYDLAPDGAVAAVQPGRRAVWASPADPAPHAVPLPFEATQVRIDGGRIAVRGHADGLQRFAVLERDGTLVGDHAVALTSHEWDFDGRRVAWGQRPCRRITVAVWDPAAGPPPDAGRACTSPQVAPDPITVARNHFTGVRLSCPADATAGCAGAVELLVRGRRPGGRRDEVPLLLSRTFDLDAGQTVVIRGPVHGSFIRMLRRRTARRLYVSVALAGQPAEVVRRPLRFLATRRR